MSPIFFVMYDIFLRLYKINLYGGSSIGIFNSNGKIMPIETKTPLKNK
jgi:hypothetical protein